MSAIPAPRFGDLFHIGMVVRDAAAAQEDLRTRLGAGPFLSTGDELAFDKVLVHGKPVPVRLKIIFCALGGTIVELLEPLDDRSPHAAFLAERGEGMHHLAFVVADLDEQLAAVRAANPDLSLLIDGTGPGNPFRWVYLDGANARETVIELWERNPASQAQYDTVRELVRR